jgi:hypothetical protein
MYRYSYLNFIINYDAVYNMPIVQLFLKMPSFYRYILLTSLEQFRGKNKNTGTGT